MTSPRISSESGAAESNVAAGSVVFSFNLRPAIGVPHFREC